MRISFLFVFACHLVLSLGGCTERVDAEVTKKSATLVDAQKKFGDLIVEAEHALRDSKYFNSDVERAEAYRYLSGIEAAIVRDKLHFNIDPAFPTLNRAVAIGNKWGYSNPDNLYLAASVSDEYGYRISGQLGSANHTIIGSYAGNDEDGMAGRVMPKDN